MEKKLQKNKTFFILFFIFSFFSFFSIAKPAETFNYSAFLPAANNSNYINAAAYYDPSDFSGQKFPLITEDIPCVDIKHNIGPGTRDYVIFGPILKLQMYLYQNEYMLYPPTGLYLHYTYDGVRNFQRENGLRETGTLDLNTRLAIKQITCETKNIAYPVPNPTPAPNQYPNYYSYQAPTQNQYPNYYSSSAPTSNPTPTQTLYYCSLNNKYYNSQAELNSSCVNTNNQITYTLNYNTNGSDIGSPSLSSQIVARDEVIVLPNQGNMFKSGYIFEGWSISPSGTNPISAGSSYTPNSNITLYAVWTQNVNSGSTYTIYYSGNGATSGLPSRFVQYVKAGESFIIDSPGTLTKSGYHFTGWSTSPTFSTILLPVNSSYTPTSDTTLYPVWAINVSGGGGYQYGGGSGNAPPPVGDYGDPKTETGNVLMYQ